MRCDHKRPNDRPINDACVNYIDQLIDELYNKIESLEKKLENISAKGYDDSELVAEIDQLKKLKADIQLLDKSFYTKTQSDSRFVTHKELMGYAQTSAHYTKRESDERYIDKYEILNYVPRCCYEHDQEEIKEIIDDINIKLNKLIELLDPSSEFLDILNHLDYDDIEVDNEYVSAVNQENGKISVTRKSLPVYEDVGVAKSLVDALAEGQVRKNSEAIDILNGDIEDEGSVKKTVADAISDANLGQYAKIDELGEIASLDEVPVSKIQNFKDEVTQVKVNSADIADKAVSDEQGRIIHDTYAEKATTFTKEEILNQDATILAEAQRYVNDSFQVKGDYANKEHTHKKSDIIDFAHDHNTSEIANFENAVAAVKVNSASEADKVKHVLTIKIGETDIQFDGSDDDVADVNAAIAEAIQKIPAQTDYTVTITESADNADANTSTQYIFTQNNNTVGTINIPKDFVVTGGSIGIVSSADDPYAGAQIGDKYIELVIENHDSVYIPANDLVIVYTPKADEKEIQIVIDAENKISASLVDKGITESKLSTDVADKLNKKWAEIATTLAGYGITDAYTKTETSNQDAIILAEAQKYADNLASNYDKSGAAEAVKDELTDIIKNKVDKEDGKSLIDTTEINRLANISDEANKVEASEVNGKIKIDGVETTVYTHPDKHAISEVTGLQDALDNLQPKGDYAEKATTLAGYGINDAYTKEEVSSQDAVVLAEAQQYTKELIDKLPAQVDYSVEITENTNDESVAKTYVFTQNNKEIGTIKLAKELVVTSGAVKEVTEADVPYAGAKVGDKYIELLIANQDAPIYVPAKDLVDIYTAKGSAAEVQIAISNTNEISATLVIGGVTEDKLAQSVQIKLNKIWEEVGVAQSLVDELANGQVTANKDAIDAINDVDNGILKQAKNYTDERLKDYATKEEAANQDAVVLAESEMYTDQRVTELKTTLEGDVDNKLSNYVTNDIYQEHVADCANSAAEAKQYTDEQVATVQSNVDIINTFTDADGKKYRFRFELAEGQPRIVYEEILTGEDN